MKKGNLPITEELDFQYLLGLMTPLHEIPEFSWLPELFSIIGYEKLLLLCKYAGGETIEIPKVEQLQESIDALQWFYDTMISKKKDVKEIPATLSKLVEKICYVYNS